MKNPILFIVMFLALSLGIIFARLIDEIDNAQPINTAIEKHITPALNELTPSANAATPINTIPLTPKPLRSKTLSTDEETELANILSHSRSFVPSASQPKPIKCIVDRQTSCSQKGCNNYNSPMWLEFNFSERIYKRCTEEQCASFRMLINKSPDFSSITIPSNGVAFRISNKESYFSEAASLAGTIVSSFGHCPQAAKYLSSL